MDFGSDNWQKLGVFRTSTCLRARINTHIGDRLFLDTPRRVAKFCENLPRDVENSNNIAKI